MKRWIHLAKCLLVFLCTCSVASAKERPSAFKPHSLSIQTLASDSVSCIIPFNRIGNLIVVKAKVDTVEGNFILDTGAPGLVLNLTYFRDYPITALHDGEQTSIAGSTESIMK